nr:Rv3654c family TadE-like protein [Pseudosporangium ferrugineum]
MPAPLAGDPVKCASRRARFAADRGAASFFVLAVGLAVVSGGVAGAAVGAARVGRHEARTAADLGALAGAMRAIEGERSACARAAELVGANGARLLSCRLEGMEIVVEVATPVTPLPGLTLRATAAARAGPARS